VALSLLVDTPKMRALAKRIELSAMVNCTDCITISRESCKRDAISQLYDGIIASYGEKMKK